MKNLGRLFCAVSLPLTALSCGTADEKKEEFPVNEAFAAQLQAKGIPSDVARFFAAAKMEAHCPSEISCVYLQTYPNGATREITLKVDPTRQYTPSSAELASSAPIYDFRITTGDQRAELTYFVPAASLAEALAKSQTLRPLAAPAGGNTTGVAWTEVGKTGADVAIGSLLDYANGKGVTLGPLASIYALASALSNVTTSVDISKQNTDWFIELGQLEQCAAQPTNPVAVSDPSYSPTAVAKVRSARSELQQVGAMRFLNLMTETGAGITPVTAALSVGLKQGFVWNESTLNNYSEETIMREARLAVVKCENKGLDGTIDVLWECTDAPPGATTQRHDVIHTISNVTWTFDPTTRMYLSAGTYKFESTRTSSLGGKTCTYTRKADGSVGPSGSIMVIDDPAVQNVLGYGYIATGSVTSSNIVATGDCGEMPSIETDTIEWLPPMSGYRSTGGGIEGTVTTPSCVGRYATGTQVVKYSFALPPTR